MAGDRHGGRHVERQQGNMEKKKKKKKRKMDDNEGNQEKERRKEGKNEAAIMVKIEINGRMAKRGMW